MAASRFVEVTDKEISEIKTRSYYQAKCCRYVHVELEIGFKFKIMHSTYILYSDKY
jgi:hypothetical protein